MSASEASRLRGIDPVKRRPRRPHERKAEGGTAGLAPNRAFSMKPDRPWWRSVLAPMDQSWSAGRWRSLRVLERSKLPDRLFAVTVDLFRTPSRSVRVLKAGHVPADPRARL